MISKQNISSFALVHWEVRLDLKWSKFQDNYRRTIFHNCLHQQLKTRSRKIHHSNLACKFSCIELFNLSLPMFPSRSHFTQKCSQLVSKYYVEEIIHLFGCSNWDEGELLRVVEWRLYRSNFVRHVPRGTFWFYSIQCDSCWGHFKWH